MLSSRILPALILSSLLLSGAEAAPVPVVDQEQIQKWIQDLGARRFSTREKAQLKLWSAGKKAEAALHKALKAEDREIRRRAQEILKKFRWGIYPSTPKNIVDMIYEYQGGSDATRMAVVKKLFDKGPDGCAALLKIAEAEEDANLRRKLYQTISNSLGRSIPELLTSGNYESVDMLMQLSVNRERSATTICNYAAYHLLRGNIEERIRHYEAKVQGRPAASSDSELLLYLYRAAGKDKEARELVGKMNRPPLQDLLLKDQGAWKTIAEEILKEQNLEDPGSLALDKLGYRVAALRLSGNHKAADQVIEAIKKHAAKLNATGSDVWYAAKVLFINKRPKAALELMGKGYTLPMKFEILCAQRKYAEAFELAKKAGNDGSGSLEQLQAMQARYLFILGDKEEAIKAFDQLAGKIKANTNLSWHHTFIESEHLAGLTDRAKEHCAKILAGNNNATTREGLLKVFYKGREETAQIGWEILTRLHPLETPKQAMQRLTNLMAGKTKGKELQNLLVSGKNEMMKPGFSSRYKGKWGKALGEIALIGGEAEQAKASLSAASASSSTPEPLIRWGDYQAKEKNWTDAAKTYEKAWELNRSNPLPLFLRGWALLQAGKKTEGRKWLETSHWLPLGDERARIAFARELGKRGHEADAKRERDLVLRTGQLNSFNVGEAHRQYAVAHSRKGEFLKAALGHERAMMRLNESYISFLERRAYVTVPHFIHRLQAKGHIKAGNLAEAQRSIELCLNLLPLDTNMPTEVIPLLEEKGKTKVANKLFEKVLAEQNGMVKAYPKSGFCHNSYAWLCAVCKRNLKEAQQHAEKAVELYPDRASYLDTLAEILFQQGQKKEAIAKIKKCIELQPRRKYYQEQLKRFEAGDPKAPLPEEA